MMVQTMNVDYDSLNEIFRTQDFLGLIAVGAPENEYEREVEDILDALESLPREEATVSRLVGIFEDIYRLRFNWSDEQMRRVRPDFEDIAHKVMNYFV
jgi:flavorubredoxin